jgi:hypothetical protein
MSRIWHPFFDPIRLPREGPDDQGNHIPGLKVTVPLAADTLPRDLVPLEGPAGEPVLELALDGSPLTVQARLNGKNYRRMLKQIDEHGAGNVVVVLQGIMRPPTSPGGPFALEGAGFQVTIKTPRPDESAEASKPSSP